MKKSVILLFLLLISGVFAQEYLVTFPDEPVLSNISSQDIYLVAQNQDKQVEKIEDQLDKQPFKLFKKQSDTEKKVKKQFTHVMNGALINASVDELEQLKEDGLITEFSEDLPVSSFLSEKIPLLEIPLIWNRTDEFDENITGKGISIAILDSGVDYTHADLGNCPQTSNINTAGCNKVIGGYDFVNDDDDPMDDHGHGTHVAGIAAANGSVKGVAPNAYILAYKVLDNGGSGFRSDIIAGLERAVQDGADIISMSLGSFCGADNYTSSCGPDDLLSRSVNTVSRSGIPVVVAAGNSGPSGNTVASPGTAVEAITVGALDDSVTIAPYSSYGPVDFTNVTGSFSLAKPDVITYGTYICSAQSSQDAIWDEYNQSYGQDRHCYDTTHINISGTSMATPFVSGIIALVLQENPEWTQTQVKTALYNSSSFVDGIPADKQGYGAVNVTALFAFEKNITAQLRLEVNESHIQVYADAYGDDFANYSLFLNNSFILSNTSESNDELVFSELLDVNRTLYNFSLHVFSTDFFTKNTLLTYYPYLEVPQGITNVSLINSTKTNITLNWTNPTNFTFLRVLYANNQIDLPNTTTNYTFTNLTIETSYNFLFYTAFSNISINQSPVTITAQTLNRSRVSNIENQSTLFVDEDIIILNWSNPTLNYNDTFVYTYKNSSFVSLIYTNNSNYTSLSSPNSNYTFIFQTRSIDGWINTSNETLQVLTPTNDVPTFTLNNLTQNSSSKSFYLQLNLSENVSEAYYYIEHNYSYTSDSVNISGWIFNDTFDLIPYITTNSINNTFPSFYYGGQNITFVFTDAWNATNSTTLFMNITKFLGGNTTDFDNDGINDTLDTIIGNESTIYSVDQINITIYNQSNSTNNLSQIIQGKQNVSITINQSELFVFDHNFSNQTLDLSEVSIFQRKTNTAKLAISGLNITGAKTIYFDLIGNTTRNANICVWNAPANSLSTMTDDCSGFGEIYLNQNTTFLYTNRTFNGSVSKVNDTRWVLENMLHTGVTQVCTEDWSCSDWSTCSSSSQSRTCTDNNACGTTRDRPVLTQSCTVADTGGDSSSGSGSSSGGGGSGGGSGTFALVRPVVEEQIETNTSDINETMNKTIVLNETSESVDVDAVQAQDTQESEVIEEQNPDINFFPSVSVPLYVYISVFVAFLVILGLVIRAFIKHRQVHKYGSLYR